MTNSANSYREAATTNFTALVNLYGSNNNPPCEGASFWKLGTAFDTMIDYLDVVDKSTAKSVEQMINTQFNAAAKCLGGLNNAWFDDFGWWTVAAQRAMQRTYFNQATFKPIHDECWRRFMENAPYVWQRRTTKTFDSYGPAINGGVWNAYWNGTSSTYPGPKNGDPSNGDLIGIQNTVTNALFLMAAQRDPNSRPAAESEFQFLITWLAGKLPFELPSLWWSLGTNTGLVRERVSGFATGWSPVVPPPFGFQPDWAWTGDQGLMLGNVSDAIPLQPAHRGLLLTIAKSIIDGSYQQLFKNGEVQNWTASGWVPSNDTGDYQTGTGVFWRNVLHVWKTNQDLRTFLAQPNYQKMLRDSADKIVNNPSDDPTFETVTNQTAVLVAAAAMLS